MGAPAVRPLLARVEVALAGKVTAFVTPFPEARLALRVRLVPLEEALAPRSVKVEEVRRPPAKETLAAPEARMEEARLGPPGA